MNNNNESELKIFDLQNNSNIELLHEVRIDPPEKINSTSNIPAKNDPETIHLLLDKIQNQSSYSKYLFVLKKRIPWLQLKDREIISNEPDFALENNSIDTSKYNMFTFLPKNLYLQFSKPANVYFTVKYMLI